MFVIVQCWYNLQEDEVLGRPLHEKIGLTLQHAGVAITVTSLTDVFAFGVGAVTVRPFVIYFVLLNVKGRMNIIVRLS